MYMEIDPVGAWERLRASRSDRPGRASSGARAKTYSAALEQAQQMFRAAEIVGPQTRPLLVFYGLSQAGRAIAAAAVALTEESWNLVSHGIRSAGLDEAFADIEIRTDPPGGAGSFVRLSELLGSPVRGNDPVVRLEEVWDTLPVTVRYPLSDRDRFHPVYVFGLGAEEDFRTLLSINVGDLPDRVVDDGSRAALDSYLAAYPAMAGYEDFTRRGMEPDSAPRYERDGPESSSLTMHWRMPAGTGTPAQHYDRLDAMTRGYAGHRYFFPAVAGLPRDLHPLMAWWAVLYPLSMLARYQPAQWAKLIDIDASRHAVPIEKLLDQAMKHLPVLIADTIEDVATWP
jgi:hypothetical protein